MTYINFFFVAFDRFGKFSDGFCNFKQISKNYSDTIIFIGHYKCIFGEKKIQTPKLIKVRASIIPFSLIANLESKIFSKYASQIVAKKL